MKAILLALTALQLVASAQNAPAASAAAAPRPADAWLPGLHGKYYQLSETLSDFPDIAKDKKPDLERVDKQIKFPSTQDAWTGTSFVDNFYVKWTGRVRIPKAGVYTFFLDSDDGSRLSIDGRQIAANEGTHDMIEISTKTELTAGDHEIVFEYFESEIDSGCILSWEGPGVTKQVIPAEAFSHKAAPAAGQKPSK